MDHGEHNQDQFRSRHTDFFSQIKYKTEVDNILVKVTLLWYPLPPLHLVSVRFSPPPYLAFSLSPHRHPSLYIPPSSLFILYNKSSPSYFSYFSHPTLPNRHMMYCTSLNFTGFSTHLCLVRLPYSTGLSLNPH